MKKAVAKKAYKKSANGRRNKKISVAVKRRKKASRQARTVKRHATRVGIAKFDTAPVRLHVGRLCRDWRREERELDHAFDADNAKAMRVHERNMAKLEAEMRRLVRAMGLDRFPVWVDY